jgi:hypothetical protein
MEYKKKFNKTKTKVTITAPKGSRGLWNPKKKNWVTTKVYEVIDLEKDQLERKKIYSNIKSNKPLNLTGKYIKGFSLIDYRAESRLKDTAEVTLTDFEAIGTFFEGETDFSLAKFKGRICNFYRATFENGDTSFSHAIFKTKHVAFSEVTFAKGDIYFDEALFGDCNVLFLNTHFCNGDVNFYNSSFGKGEISFWGANFGTGKVNFYNTDFGEGNILFHSTHFAGNNIKMGITFNFQYAKFGDGYVEFIDSVFGKGNISFLNAKFGKGTVNFRGVKFGDGDVIFRGTQFGKGNVYFVNAQFGKGKVDFVQAQFGEGNIDFGDAKFGKGDVDFSGARFGKGDVIFNFSTFDDSSNLIFKDAKNISGIFSILGISCNSVNFSKTTLYGDLDSRVEHVESLSFQDAILHTNIDLGDYIHDGKTFTPDVEEINFINTKLYGKIHLDYNKFGLKQAIEKQTIENEKKD